MTERDKSIDSFESQAVYNHPENNVQIRENEIDAFSFENIVSFYEDCDLSLKEEIKETDNENKAIVVDIFYDELDVKNELSFIEPNESFGVDDKDGDFLESKNKKCSPNNILTNQKTDKKVIPLLEVEESAENSSEIEDNENEDSRRENEQNQECIEKAEIPVDGKNNDGEIEFKLCTDITFINELMGKIEIKDEVSGNGLPPCEQFISKNTNDEKGNKVKELSVQKKFQEFDDSCDNDCYLFYESSSELGVKNDENNFHTRRIESELFSDTNENTDLIYSKNTEKSNEDNFNDKWKICRESFKKCDEFLEDCDAIEDKFFNENSEESDEDNDYEIYENFHTKVEKCEENNLSHDKVQNNVAGKWKFYENDQICTKLEQIKISDGLYGKNNSEDVDDNEQDILRSRGPEKGSQKKHNEKPYGKKSTLCNLTDCFQTESEAKQICHVNFPPSFDILHDESLNTCFSDSGYASSPASSIQFTDTNEDKAKSSNVQIQTNVEEFTNLTLLELFSEEHVLRSLESIVNDTPNNVLGHDANQSSANINSSTPDNNCFNMNILNSFGENNSNDNTRQSNDDYFQEHVDGFSLPQITPRNKVNNDGKTNESSAVKAKNKTLHLKKNSKNLTSKTIPEKRVQSPKRVPVPLVCKFQDGDAKSQLYSILHKDRLRLALSKYYRRNLFSDTDEIIYVTDLKGEKGKHLNMTNLHVAVLNSDFEEIYAIVELQKQYKKNFFDINTTDATGKTALDYAVTKKLPLIGNYLIENNAKQSIVINKYSV